MTTLIASPPNLVRTMSQDRPKSAGRQYTDDEWDTVKQPFYHYYMEKNLSLREAARLMRDNHNFDATLRQWERRIAPEKWNFTKYANREDRLRQIEAARKSLLDVAHRGRRKSTGSPDARPSLLDDRNMRRFARRELSREPGRPRARSVSATSDASDQEMGGMSNAASPAPSESYEIDNSEANGTFPDISFNDMSTAWPPSSQQSRQIVPEIRIDQFSESLDIPHITYSGPEDAASYISPKQIPISRQSQVNVPYPVTTESSVGIAFPRENDLFEQGYDSSLQMDSTSASGMEWNNTNPFPAETSRHGEDNAGYDYTNISFTSMLSSDDQVTDHRSITINSLDAFNNADLGLVEPVPTPTTPDDTLPDFDNTHSDVHAALQEHYSRTMEMIRMCFHGCENAVDRHGMMNHLTLLEKGVQAQNLESDHNLRTTLKNIASTQRQANRSIFELSKTRKKKIDELKAQVIALQSQGDGQGTYPYD